MPFRQGARLRTKFRFELLSLPAVWSQKTYSTTLGLGFFFCRARMVIPPLQGYSEERKMSLQIHLITYRNIY